MTGNRQAFSTDEFRARVSRVHKEMERGGIDLLVIHSPENIYYLTGYQTSGYFAYQAALVAQGRDPELLVRFLERGNVNEYSWLDHAQTWKEGDDLVEATLGLIRSSGSHRAIGLEKKSWFLTAAIADALAARLADARILDASLLVDRVRIIKSEAEISYLRRAGEIAGIEQRAALEAMRPGVSETEVAAAVFNAGVKAGCEYTGLPHHIMSGYRYDVCHANWIPKPIVRGELVLLDMIAKIKASAARPQYDLVILSGFGASTLAGAGLLEKLPADELPNLAQVVSEYRTGADGYGVGYFLWSDGLVFNSKAYANAPKSFGVLWDDSNKGKIFLPPADNLYALELIIVAARMAGGDAMNPDPGFQKLAELKDRSLLISSNANQLADMFRSSSLNAGGVYSPLEMSSFIPNPEYNLSGTYDLEEGFFVDLQYMVVPKGHPADTEVIAALVNHALDPNVQGKMAEEVWYGPINQDAVMSEQAVKSPYIPSPAVIKNRTVKVDAAHLASVRDDWIKRYTEAVS